MFDYGCGRGEDVEYLKGMGFKASGWDPIHFDFGEPKSSDVVNLGYVINVIEVPQERKETLKKAFSLAKKALIVSAQVGYFDDQIARSTEFEDGYLTSRNTFQKYFEQDELRDYVRETLGQEPYAAGIGIYYVFRDTELENAYCRRLFEDALPEAFQGLNLNLSLSAETLTSIAGQVLQLGRLPEPTETPELAPALAILSASESWLKRLSPYLPQERLAEIEASRKREFLGRLLASYFGPSGKLRMCDLSESQRADLRCFFGSYVRATGHVENLYQTLVERFENLGEHLGFVSVEDDPVPDEVYYLWHCLVETLELSGSELKGYCPSSLRLEWQQSVAETERWTYCPSRSLVYRSDVPEEEGQLFNLFSRRRTTEGRAAQPRGVPAEILLHFVQSMLELGRFPTATEFTGPKNHWGTCIRQKLWESSLQNTGQEMAYEAARKLLWESILYRIGTALFQPGGRPQFKKWPERFQTDVKSVFGSFAQACAESDSWMRRMGDIQYVESEIRGAGKGKAHPEKGLYFHASLLHQQPLVVQLLIETARQIGAGEMPPQFNVVRCSYNGDVVKFYDYEEYDLVDEPRLRSFCKVMFRKRRVFGKDYPVSSTKVLDSKLGLLGEALPCQIDD